MLEKPLPPNHAVPEPIIMKYFPKFVKDLPLIDRAEDQVCYDRVL